MQSKSVRHQLCALRLVTLIGAIVALVSIPTGCASTKYQVPGSAADFRAMGITPTEVEAQTDVSIARKLDRKPLARFPSAIAVVRVQGRDYSSYTARGYGNGNFTIVTTRDVEGKDAFNRIGALPMVSDVLPLNHLVMPERLTSEQDLRGAAANVQADMLLIYTFDTEFHTHTTIQPLGLLTLGLFPDRKAYVTSTATAALLDTRNGYVYGVAEATGRDSQITNAWNNEETIDQSRRKAEKQAFDELVGEVANTWSSVVKRYGPGSEATAAANP